MAEDQRLTPGAGSLFIACSDRIDDVKAVFRNSIWGFDGANWNRAIVDSSGAFKVTGSGGGGGGTVDQGVAGTDPWLVKIDQTGTNNDVNISGTVDVSGSVVTIQEPLSVDDNGSSLTVDGTVAVSSVGGTVTISGTVTANQGTSPWVTADNQTLTDNNAFTDGTSKVSMSGHVFDEVAGTALTENDAAASRIDSKRAQVMVIEDDTNRGNRVSVDSLTHSLHVKIVDDATGNDVTETQVITDNAAFTDGTSKVFMAGFVFDETPGTALTENDAAAARIDSKRASIVAIEDATTRGQRASVSSGGEFSLTELPATAALADGAANPTVSQIGALYLQAKIVDGTLSWDRVPHSFYQNRTGAGTGAGAGTAIDMTAGPCSKFGLEVENATGTTSAWNINLEGSMDNGAYFTLTNQTSATGAAQLTFTGDKPVRFCRSNVTSVTGGGTVRIRILAMNH